MATELFMPKMSDHMEVGVILAWLVKEGDRVKKGQPLLELETDKATVELEAPASGIIKAIRAGVESGANVPVGETMAYIAEPDEEVTALPPLGDAGHVSQPVEQEPPAASATTPLPAQAARKPGRPRAVPAVRKLARELGVDLALIHGTGREGRITEQDIKAYISAQEAKPPEKATAELASPVARRMAEDLGVNLAEVKGSGPKGRIIKEDVQAFAQTTATAPIEDERDEWLELTTIQRLTGQRMIESVQTAPQFSLDAAVDMTKLLEFRAVQMDRIAAAAGERLSVTGILVKAVAIALKQFPRANASFNGGRIKLHKVVHVGVAVGTNEGLVVPVIKDADQKTLVQITQALANFQEKAASMRFHPDDLSGGTFTISNLGMYGVDRFNAIVNPPQSAILAVGRIIKTPVGMPDNTIMLRPMMSMTLSVDHRSMDGLQAAKLLAILKECLEEPYLLTQ